MFLAKGISPLERPSLANYLNNLLLFHHTLSTLLFVVFTSVLALVHRRVACRSHMGPLRALNVPHEAWHVWVLGVFLYIKWLKVYQNEM